MSTPKTAKTPSSYPQLYISRHGCFYLASLNPVVNGELSAHYCSSMVGDKYRESFDIISTCAHNPLWGDI